MRISKLGLCALLAATSVNAATKAEIEDFDLNGNGFIEPGQEVRLLKNHLMAEFTAEQATLASNIDDPGFKQRGSRSTFSRRIRSRSA
ncbi:MAG: hypothetical protein IPL47_01985 [Phyllobacteriaceae bacterium]|nr:hypothetical protein [Phyllobacteriaceae bacterium]